MRLEKLTWLRIFQVLLFMIFVATQQKIISSEKRIKQIPPSIDKQQIHLLSFGDEALISRLILFWLQTFDSQSGEILLFDQLNYDHLINWLVLSQSLDPESAYPLLTASRIFIEVKNETKMRKIIKFVHQRYLESPNTRWRWLVDVILIAKHRLKDLNLALHLASDLRLHSTAEHIPYWVRDIEHLVLAELGEIESAIRIIDSLLQDGTLKDPREIRFLTEQLKSLQSQYNK